MILELIQLLGSGLLIGFLLGIAVMLFFQEYSQPKISNLLFYPEQWQAKEKDYFGSYFLPPGQTDTPVAMLIAFEGMYKGLSWSLNYAATNTIGRFEDCDIALNDHSISRLHAQITHHIDASNNNQFALFNYSRRNNTKINGLPINTVVSLKDGDEVQIGSQGFVFHRL